MFVASLIDLGASVEVLENALKSIPIQGFETKITRVSKSDIDACDFNVILNEEYNNHDHDMKYLYGKEESHAHGEHHHHEHRGLTEIYSIIDGTNMLDSARTLAKKIFRILAEAEAKAHGVPVEEVHFHEVGALDSIVDIIAAAACVDNLGVDEVIIPALWEGEGTVRCQHGILPVPVPAPALSWS